MIGLLIHEVFFELWQARLVVGSVACVFVFVVYCYCTTAVCGACGRLPLPRLCRREMTAHACQEINIIKAREEFLAMRRRKKDNDPANSMVLSLSLRIVLLFQALVRNFWFWLLILGPAGSR